MSLQTRTMLCTIIRQYQQGLLDQHGFIKAVAELAYQSNPNHI